MLVKSLINREHILERNPNYRFEPYPCEGEAADEKAGMLADCGKPTPFLDRIVMTMEKEAIPTTTKFLQGYYDSPQIMRLDVGQGYLVAMGDDPEKREALPRAQPAVSFDGRGKHLVHWFQLARPCGGRRAHARRGPQKPPSASSDQHCA